MAKLVPVQLYCISVIGGIYSNGDKFIIMSLNENQNANSGAIKLYQIIQICIMILLQLLRNKVLI